MPTDNSSTGVTPLDLVTAALIDIKKQAEDARSNHSVQGHYCDLRAAIDSIFDRSSAALKVALQERRGKARKIDPSWCRYDGKPTPFTMEEFETVVDAICKCDGKHDCNCTSVFGRASQYLWTKHNRDERVRRTGIEEPEVNPEEFCIDPSRLKQNKVASTHDPERFWKQ